LMGDARESIIPRRLEQVSTILPIMSYKGGVGKTTVSSLLSLRLAELGYSVGLLDLDFTNPSAHRILGLNVEHITLREEKGVLPADAWGVKLMSLAFFTKENPSPLRGTELNEVFKELLAVTIWGKLDFLIVDMPPGLSDVTLDFMKYMRSKSRALLVSAQSILSIVPTLNLARLAEEAKISVLGVVIDEGVGSPAVSKEVEKAYAERGLRVIATVARDEKLELAYGNLPMLKRSPAYSSVKELADRVLNLLKEPRTSG